MKNFKVSLTRVYHVNVEAKDKEKASELVEYYIGDPKDASTIVERENENFRISEIEMVYNEATEVEEIN